MPEIIKTCIKIAHFSYLGGVEAIREKIKAFSHDEYNNDKFLSDENLLTSIRAGKDIFGRDLKFSKVEVDASFPAYIQQRIEELEELILK